MLQFWTLSLDSLGVVFGDIGTSPIYVFKTLLDTEPTDEEVVGACSLVIWSLLLIVVVKYSACILRAKSDGEGGIFALGMLVVSSVSKNWVARIAKVSLIFGAGLLIADGALTPAISVLSAVETLQTYSDDVTTTHVLVITISLLVLLFAFQSKGTSKIGRAFGPIIFVWFLDLFCVGIWRITQQPSILKAFSPHYAVLYLADDPPQVLKRLGGAFLSVTGVEALYADLGHFGAGPIHVATSYALTALIIQYFGQASLLLTNSTFHTDPFSNAVPEWMQWPHFGLSICATIIASQAIISGCYSIISQAISLGYCPPLLVLHTSTKVRGQIYIPLVNWVVFALTTAFTLGFASSANIAHAYGLTISTIMLLTTGLFAIAVRSYFRKPVVVALLVLLFYVIEIPFWVANIEKFVEGAWVTLVISLCLTVPLSAWYFGQSRLQRTLKSLVMTRTLKQVASALGHKSNSPSPSAEGENGSAASSTYEREPESESESASPPTRLDLLLQRSSKQARMPGTAVFFVDRKASPPVFEVFLNHFHLLPSLLLFVRVKTIQTARVRSADRCKVTDLGHNTYYVKIRYGFAQHNKDLSADLLKAVKREELPKFDPSEISYILSKEWITLAKPRWYQRVYRWLFSLYALLKGVYVARPACTIPQESEISLGFAAEI